MPFKQDNPRDTLIMRIAAGITTALLLLTVVISFQFNLAHDGVWFFRAALFLVLGLILFWRLCLHIPQSWLRTLIAVAGVELAALFATGRLVSFYYQGESFNQEFLFHFNRDTFGFALSAFPGLLALTFGFLVLIAVAAYFSVFRLQSIPMRDKTFWVLPALLFVWVVDPDISGMAQYSMRNANTASTMELASIDWEGTGLKREALYKSINEISAGKNVVMLYLESVEQMYTDDSVYPGLTPYLTALRDEALVFENIFETSGTNFTVAGILSSQCGTPLIFSTGPGGPAGNDILKNGFMQEANCFGDILDAAGYEQIFMGGASTRFAGKGVFLSDHGYDEVNGLEELYPFVDDPDYFNNWGLFDDSLFGIAAQKFDEVAASTDRPFNFTVLTVDTHPPDGQISRSCTPYDLIDNQMIHSVHCADQMVERFITHLKQSPAWDNTVVMIMSDHLHMRNSGMEFYPPDYERKLLVYMLNAGSAGVIETPGTHMDLAPTLLSLMGVRHEQVFLAGDDLLAPATNTRVFDPSNTSRLAAIRYLNMNLLSRIESGLCEADPLYSIERSDAARYEVEVEGNRLSPWRVRVAGKEIDLSRRGRVLPTESIGETYALLSLVTTEGKVGLTFPVLLELLPYQLLANRENSFLLLTPRAPIADMQNIPEYQGMGLLFGNLIDGLQVLGENLDIEQGFSADTDCEELVDMARDYDVGDVDNLLGSICIDPDFEGFALDEDLGRLRLNSVTYGASRFKADLRRNNEGWYSVIGLEEIGPIKPEGNCDAFYGNQEILIPAAMNGNEQVSIVLRKVPGVPLTFELDNVIPLVP